MSQEMSFAEALTEARQIIVQQSNRIKKDLEKINALQETIASLSETISANERSSSELSSKLSESQEQVNSLTEQVKQATLAREQAEAVIDRQGLRLSQGQETIARLEQQTAEHSERVQKFSDEIESLRKQLPTQEDSDALASLSELLSTKKINMPAAGEGSGGKMRLTSHRAKAA